ncbi:hypothetical protein UW163_21060 (plasmid) [Ralstonia solanacearum]|nr:hypothetical protein UW163_21060 [Ralstonia solanacearum]AMP76106.1 hypothetical protein RALBFv3_18045 [Ralstonia solanacearum]EUJ12662.1 hypothetical protein RSP673_19935 [Ralstonia solanacearum P673]OAI67791.1 hypothetical protein RSP797_20670 [Ralstonia solanacearum]
MEPQAPAGADIGLAVVHGFRAVVQRSRPSASVTWQTLSRAVSSNNPATACASAGLRMIGQDSVLRPTERGSMCIEPTNSVLRSTITDLTCRHRQR